MRLQYSVPLSRCLIQSSLTSWSVYLFTRSSFRNFTENYCANAAQIIATDIESVKSIRPSTYFISEMKLIYTKFNIEFLVTEIVVGRLLCGFMLAQ